MNRVSLDGRARSLSHKPALATSQQSQTAQTKNLRPAPPPRVNPWRHIEISSANHGVTPDPFTRTHPDSDQGPRPQDSPTILAPCWIFTRTPSPERMESQTLQGEVKTQRSSSKLSNESRNIFRAAAPRAGENLWKRPFGADIHLHTPSAVFKLHRSVVVPESGWFRDNLPAPNADGSPVDVYMPYAADAIAHSLRFMYTQRLEICDFDKNQPMNIIHIPRCVLGYCSGLALQIRKLMVYVLHVVRLSASPIGNAFAKHYFAEDGDYRDTIQLCFDLHNALDIMYAEPSQMAMRPMRMALAGVFDALVPGLLQHPVFIQFIQTDEWYVYSRAVSEDQVEYRRQGRKFVVDEEALAVLLDNFAPKPVRPQPQGPGWSEPVELGRLPRRSIASWIESRTKGRTNLQ